MPASTPDDNNQTEAAPSDAAPTTGPTGEDGGAVAAAVHSAIDVMSTCDLDRCDLTQLGRLANAAQRVRGFLLHFDTRLAARRHQLATTPFDPGASGNDGGGVDGDTGPGDASDQSGSERDRPDGSDAAPDPTLEFAGPATSRPDAERDRDRARAVTLALLPRFARALELGEIDGAHVDALTAALDRFDVRTADEAEAHRELLAREAELLGYARVENPRNFRRRCLELSLRLARDHGLRLAERQRKAAEFRSWIDHTTGMGHMHATLEPELFEKVMTAIDLQLASLKKLPGSAEVGHRRLRVEAFAELIHNSGELCPRTAEVLVLCDEATLRTGLLADGSVCETADGTPLHPETLRRMACDARIIPAVLDGEGRPIDMGRARYEPTSAQRRALATMYRSCAHPECEVPFRRCRIHHVIFWDDLGPTDLDNLLPLCERHHHMVHEGGWRLTMTPDRVITLTSPSGVLTFTGDTRDRRRMRNLVTSHGGAQSSAGRCEVDESSGSAEYESDLADPSLPRRITASTRHGPSSPRIGSDAAGLSHRRSETGTSAARGGGANRSGQVRTGSAPIAKRRRRRTRPADTGDPTLFHDDRQASAP